MGTRPHGTATFRSAVLARSNRRRTRFPAVAVASRARGNYRARRPHLHRALATAGIPAAKAATRFPRGGGAYEVRPRPHGATACRRRPRDRRLATLPRPRAALARVPEHRRRAASRGELAHGIRGTVFRDHQRHVARRIEIDRSGAAWTPVPCWVHDRRRSRPESLR